VPAWIGRTAHTCWTVTHQLLYHKLHHSLNVISDNTQHTHSMKKVKLTRFGLQEQKDLQDMQLSHWITIIIIIIIITGMLLGFQRLDEVGQKVNI